MPVISVRVSDALARRIEAAAQADCRTPAQQVLFLVQRALRLVPAEAQPEQEGDNGR